LTYKQGETHLVLFVGLSVIVIGAIFMAAFVAAVTALQPFQEASAQLGEIDTFLFSKTDRDLQQLLDAFETSPPTITAVITNATASEAPKI
jgi:hypothetical protein